MHQLGRARGGAGGPVGGLHQADVQSAASCVEGGAGAVDPSPDHQHVQGTVRRGRAQSLEVVGTGGSRQGYGAIVRHGELLSYELIWRPWRSEEHTSELQSRGHLVCRLLLETKGG